MTSTTTPLRSLADPSGVFDAPTLKCPPDRGSQDWVTDSLAPESPSSSPSSAYSSLSSSSYDTDYFQKSIVFPPTPPPENSLDPFDQEHHQFHAPSATSPKDIKQKNSFGTGLQTPPMTPEEDVEGVSAISARQTNEFLTTLFPRSGLSALPHAKGVSVSAPNLGTVFDGVVLELPGKPKTFYVDGKNAAEINLRESIVALLDLADEQLECTALVIALERSSPGLGDLLHSLMYVGGTVVTKPPFQADPAYVLVGLEI